MIGKWVTLGALLFVPGAVMAQEARTRSFVGQLIEGVLPVIIIFFCLWLFLRFTMKKNRNYQQRTLEHMDRIEQQYDKIIELMGKMVENHK